MSQVDKFLDAIEGTTIPYVEVTENAQNPYCDSCSDPIRPNTKVQLYGVNKILPGRVIESGFRSIRLHCEDCHLRRLHMPCAGYDEYLIDATVTPEWTITDPEIQDISSELDGIPYKPEEILESLFGVSYTEILIASGGESQGPLDAIDVLVVTGIDPREVVNDDGSITVTQAHRKQFSESAMQIFEKYERGGGPPQPSASEKLRAFFETEPEE